LEKIQEYIIYIEISLFHAQTKVFRYMCRQVNVKVFVASHSNEQYLMGIQSTIPIKHCICLWAILLSMSYIP
jgi:hypothetical protein